MIDQASLRVLVVDENIIEGFHAIGIKKYSDLEMLVDKNEQFLKGLVEAGKNRLSTGLHLMFKEHSTQKVKAYMPLIV